MKLASPRFAALTILAALLLSGTSTMVMAKPTLLYIATQNPDGMGITIAEFDSATGALSTPKMAIETRDPAHFTLSKDGRHLYMCNTGTPGGVSAFAMEKYGGLRLLNYKESKSFGARGSRTGQFQQSFDFSSVQRMELRQAVELASFQLSLHPRGSIAAPAKLLAGTRKAGARYRLSRPREASYVACLRSRGAGAGGRKQGMRTNETRVAAVRGTNNPRRPSPLRHIHHGHG